MLNIKVHSSLLLLLQTLLSPSRHKKLHPWRSYRTYIALAPEAFCLQMPFSAFEARGS